MGGRRKGSRRVNKAEQDRRTEMQTRLVFLENVAQNTETAY